MYGLSGYGVPAGCSQAGFVEYHKLGMPRQQDHRVKEIDGKAYKPFSRGLCVPPVAWDLSDDSDNDSPDAGADTDLEADTNIMSDKDLAVVQDRHRRAQLEHRVAAHCIIAIEPGADTSQERRDASGKQSWWVMWVTEVCQASSSQVQRLSERAGVAIPEGATFYKRAWFEPNRFVSGRSEIGYVWGERASDEWTQADQDAGVAGSIAFPSQLLVVNPEMEELPDEEKLRMTRTQCHQLRYYRQIYCDS